MSVSNSGTIKASFRGGYIYQRGWREVGRHVFDVITNRPVPTVTFSVYVAAENAVLMEPAVELDQHPMADSKRKPT